MNFLSSRPSARPTGSRSGRGRRFASGALIQLVVLSLIATGLQTLRPSAAGAEIATFPEGTEVEVTIDSPEDGSAPVDGRAELVGTTRVGAGDTPRDTSLVVVYDLSGSTLDPAGGDCGGDVNGDGSSNTILDCEIAAMETLEQTALALGSVAEMGVTLFELGSAAADLQPASGIQRLTEPGADLNSNGVTDIAEVVRSSRWTSAWFSADATVSLFTRLDAGTGNGGTNYSAGLSNACNTLAATSQPNRTIVFLSDGGANRGTDVTGVLPCSQEATVYSVAVGANSTCAADPSGLGSLQEVADLTGGTCTEVISPEDLPDILSGIISPEIYRLTLSVNGGAEIDISDATSSPLPARGPDPLDWAYTVEGLSGPADTICVTSFARREAEEVQVTECIELISDRPPVADAGGDQTVDEGSVVELDGSDSFDPDGEPLSYSWEIISQSGAPIILSSTTEPIASFIAFDDGEYELRLTVFDGRTEATDIATITVENVAPTATGLAEPAAEGGVALITASFTDPGILDSHTATVDWGDATPLEPVDISAQGNGWGSLYASHVYGDAGSFTATITITDDDGGVDTVQSVSVEVRDSLALWANSETERRTIDLRGGTATIDGLVHSNNEIRATGASKTFTGRVEYVGSTSFGNNVSLEEPAQQVPVADFPVKFNLADFVPGGRAAIDAGAAYFDMSSECGRRWDPAGPLPSGLYYVPCDVKLNSSALAGTVTIAASGDVQVSGSGADFEPFIDGLLFLSGSSSNKALQVSASGSTFLGYLFTEDGRVDLAGAGNTYLCGILGDRIDITDSDLSIRASDCIRPERTVAPPTLVPTLGLDVTTEPANVLPGDTVTVTTDLTNEGALLLVPGIVGLENLGDGPVTVTDIEIGIEYRPVGGGWTTLTEPLTVAASPNLATGVSYPTGTDPFSGTVIDGAGFATWAAEVQVELEPSTVALLLDASQVEAVRNTFTYTLDNPNSEPVRALFRYGNDFASDLRALGGDLTDLRVVATNADGSTAILTSADEPQLATLTAGQTVSVVQDAVVPVPEARGEIEPVAAYRGRLTGLDNTELFGSAFAISTGGVGTVLGEFDFASTARLLPIVGLGASGPDALVAGDTAAYNLDLRNTGSAQAVSVVTTVDVDGTSATVTGLPSSVDPGVIANGSASYSVPADQPIGVIEATAASVWQDANGNVYGDVFVDLMTDIGSPPDLSTLLADAVFIDADNSGLPSAGDTLRYTATITNRGSTAATGVTFTATPDPAASLVVGSVLTSAGTVTSGNGAGDSTVTIDVGAVAPMTSSEITFDALIETGATVLSVQGTVDSDDADPFPTDDPGASGLSDPTVTNVVETPPSIQAALVGRLGVDTDADDQIGPGDTVEYALQITNAGLTSATNVVASVTPDVNTTLVVGSVEIEGVTIVTGNNPGDTSVAVRFDDLGGLQQSTIRFQAIVNDPVPSGVTTISVQASVSSDQLPDVLSDDPTVGGNQDPTVLGVLTTIPGGGGGGGGTGTGGGPGSGNAPGPAFTFESIGPGDGATVSAPVPVTAGIPTPPDGTTIDSWQVIAYPATGFPSEGIVLVSGTGTPPTGDIASFDPSVVSNGSWVIRVEATDSNGGVGYNESTVTVEGGLKLGRYAVTYLDSSVSVGGIPLRVNRTYDTLARLETDDYGYGWSLDVANFEVATNRPLGEGPWTAESCGAGLIFVPICWSAETPRLVNITWPNGRVESFSLAPTGNTFFPIIANIEYEARPGTTSELRPAPGNESGGFLNGELRAGAFGFGDLYNPQQFLLIADDGTEYLLDRDLGLIQATDRYGNTVTYTDDGIVSSLGPALTFTRDGEGRITALTEPSGESVTYVYDAAGDLVSSTDQAGNETTFTYQTGHYLSVIDDAGPGPYRTLNYGPDGRVESITDAEGNTTAVSVDLDDRSQIVTAPDGQSTRVTAFDERGNPLAIDHVYDGESHVSTLVYDGNDRVTSRTDPLGNTWGVTWDEQGNMTSFTDPTGARTSYTYGAFNMPVAITDAEGATRTFEYDGVGNLIAVNHPVGATSGFDGGSLAADAAVAGGRETFSYDGVGNVLTRTDALGSTWTWSYDSSGNISSVVDPLGQTTTYTYDSQGRMLTETNAEGETTTYTYDSVGDLTSMSDPLGRAWSWSYDSRGNAVGVTDPGGFVTTYTYDDTNNLTTETDPEGRTWTYAYGFDRLVSSTAPDGGVATYGYDSAGRLARLIDPVGRTVEFGYDIADRWTTTVYPYGDGQTATETNELDAAGFVTAHIDGLGERWTYERDSVGRVTRSSDPLGNSSQTEFDALGRPLRVIDPLGNATTYSYDQAGQVISMGRADGGVVSYEYDAVGNQVAAVDPLNRRTSRTFDAAYRLLSTTDPSGAAATNVYNDAGQVTASTSFAGVQTSYAYEARGLVASVTDGEGNSSSYSYDDSGLVTSFTDNRGATTSFGYDPNGRPTTTTDALSGVATIEYDLDGQMVAVVDPLGNRRRFAYDDGGSIESVIDPLGRTWTALYDAVGQRSTTIDPRGIEVNYSYDAARRMTARSTPSETTSWSFDAASRRVSMIDPTGTTNWVYDVVGRVTEVDAPAGDVGYSYDIAGQLSSLVQPEGAVSYTYDSAGFLDAISDWNGTTVAVDTDADGRLTSIARPNGLVTSYDHDDAGRLVSVVHADGAGAVASYDYQLDGNGNRSQVAIDDASGIRTEAYSYDPINRLTAADYGDGNSEQFTYDAAGNRLSRTIVGGPDAGATSYTYDAAQQLASVTVPGGSTSLSYDPAGNLLDDGQGSTFVWDDLGRSTQVSANGVSEDYSYDGDGIRVAIDGAGQVWDRIGSVERLVSDGDQAHLHLGGHVLSSIDGATTQWPLADALGSVRVVTDDAGGVSASRSYRAYGEVLSSFGSQPAFGFAGEQLDGTGLIHLRSRSYNPATGRFVSVDSVQPNGSGTQGWNLYGYANSNPTTFIDPTGNVAAVEYASLLRNSVVTQTAFRLLGLCIKGILEGIAIGLVFAAVFGYDYEFEWEWALVDCAIEIIFAGFGPPSGPKPKPPKPDPPKPKPDPPRPKTPDNPPRPKPKDPNPPKPRDPDAPPRPRDPDSPRPRDPDAPPKPKGPDAPSPGPKCSFSADTLVLMGDGGWTVIGDIQVGDEVMASDPETGRSGARTVMASWPHDDELMLLRTSAGQVMTTEDHLYWNDSDAEWQQTQDLDAGDLLRSSDGTEVEVIGLDWSTTRLGLAYDLTVSELSTFYVSTGDGAVLVHNCPPDLDALAKSGQRAAKGGRTAAGRAYQKHMGRGELPNVPGSQLDNAGQNLLEDILTNPNSTVSNVTGGNFPGGTRFVGPDGVGAVFDAAGDFQYFGVGMG